MHVLKKKRFLLPLSLVLLMSLLNLIKHPFVVYLPFDIPGNQMASTIPPFGIFIESTYQNENSQEPCSILSHERVHWEQYKRMGLVSFHYTYVNAYVNSGRINHWMEEEARQPCRRKGK